MIMNRDIAIIGIAGMFPCAPDLNTYWQNIISKVDAISDPPEGWAAKEVFDPNSIANDRIYCKRGGFLGDIARFNPLEYGIMPSSVDGGGDPEQFLALRVAYEAFYDAGYTERPIDRTRVEVIVGKGAYVNRGHTNVIQHGLVIDQTLEILKRLYPEYTGEKLHAIKQELKASLLPFNAETVPALIPNITTGRIANRFDLMGANYTVDAACASSMIAVEIGVQNLAAGKCDLAIVGGVHAAATPLHLMLFSQINALSRKGKIRPFDKDADGTLLGEGVGMVVLKRLEDAERDGDRIYAVVKGIGTASDGRALGLLAPRLEGEELALRRAYESTGISPCTIGLIEAHGTGTQIGDVTEIQALSKVFGPRNGVYPWCAVGSVKSMISHLIPAAGIAGLIKTVLALYHKILPPTLNCDEPNPKLNLDKTPFYINTETRPWIHGRAEPRRAGVNAFGFGGINTHAILEEYTGTHGCDFHSFLSHWDTEVFIIRGESRQNLIKAGEQLLQFISNDPMLNLKDLAYTVNCPMEESEYRLAIVATSVKDLEKKLTYGLKRLADSDCTVIKDKGGIFFFEKPLGREGTVAFLFPGEGSQYVNMLSDLCLHFPEVRACYDRIDRAFFNNKSDILPSQVLFPLPLVQQTEAVNSPDQVLWQMDFAVSSVFSANRALFTLLNRLEIRPDAVVGHSSGEFAALLASGAVEVQDEDQIIQHALELIRITESLEDQIPEAKLMAVGAADPSIVASMVAESGGSLQVAMDNCPHQVVLCGSEATIISGLSRFQSQGAFCNLLPMNRAYHTSQFQRVCDEFFPFFQKLKIVPPHTTIYSCATVRPYPKNIEEIRRLAVGQWAKPVRFRETIRAMYDDRVRIFVEVGPRGNLTSFVDDILQGCHYVTIPTNVSHRSGISQINYMAGLLAAHGVHIRLDYLYVHRSPKRLSFGLKEGSVTKSRENGGAGKIALDLPRMSLLQDRQAEASNVSPASRSTFSPHGEKQEDPKSEIPQPQTTHAQQTFNFNSVQEKQDKVLSHRDRFKTHVVQEYLQTMERFLNMQQEIMMSFMTRKDSKSSTAGDETAAGISSSGDRLQPQESPAAKGPFCITISSLTPGKEVSATCRLDLDEHLFLHDHTFGRNISVLDNTLRSLSVVPLAVSLEIMAQIAAFLVPDRRLIAIKNARGYRWIEVEEGKYCTLLLIATRNGSDHGETEEIKVKIWEMDKVNVSEISDNSLLVEGTMVFGNEYPEPPGIGGLSIRSEGQFRFSREQYYSELIPFGPTFQSVISIDRSGDDGAEATMRVPPGVNMFRSHRDPKLFTDPILIDAAGQVVGLWAQAHLNTGFIAFPTGIDALYLYGPSTTNPVKCYAQMTLLDDGRIQSNLDLVESGGRFLMRLMAWEDMRFFDWTRQYIQFMFSTRDIMLSTSYPGMISDYPEHRKLQCCRILKVADGIWPKALAYLILSRREREIFFHHLTGPEKRRKEWLLGRLVAKDAVRLLLKDRYQLKVCPADIEIASDENGRPIVGGELIQRIDCKLSISISHSMGGAVAVVCDDGNHRSVGIDMEHISRGFEGLERAALTEKEQSLLSAVPTSKRDEWLLRLWCAKEAAAKAVGEGMLENIKNLIIEKIQQETGCVSLAVTGALAHRLPRITDTVIHVYTSRDAEYVFAISDLKIIQ